MSDKKTMNEELGMEYSPILGVTYGLVNVTENEDSEERDELHDFDLVMNLMVADLDEGPEYDSAGFSIEDRDEEEYEIIYNPKKFRPEKRLKKVTPEEE
jgi:hypothetical protein